jgi:H+/Cl- antiporter ClcA
MGDLTVAAWGVAHTPYHIAAMPGGVAFYGRQFHYEFGLIWKAVIASVAFGLVSYAFAKAVHLVKALFNKWIKISWLIPVCGGVIIILLTLMIGKPDYLSLGVSPEYPGAVTIVSAFQQGGASVLSWFWKLIFTAITLGTGFKGGEVTPLFYIGATLGNTLAGLLHAPVSLFAALGFIAVFSGATKTPLACTIMGMELFGPGFVLFYAIACFVAYLCSGKAGIYSAQRR